jgi:hypothetical protein
MHQRRLHAEPLLQELPLLQLGSSNQETVS